MEDTLLRGALSIHCLKSFACNDFWKESETNSGLSKKMPGVDASVAYNAGEIGSSETNWIPPQPMTPSFDAY